MSFVGFTNDEIIKLRGNQARRDPAEKSNKPTTRKAETLITSKNRPSACDFPSSDLREEPKLTVELNKETEISLIANKVPINGDSEKEKSINHISDDSKNEHLNCDQSRISQSLQESDKEVHIVKSRGTTDLALFDARQKIVEEQNRKRKELIAKAIDEKMRQTTEEAAHLRKIKDDFKQLDAVLSMDICIIRNQIEEATVKYNKSEKRYQQAEKEFCDAKLQLEDCRNKRDLLMEHLRTIIEINEERKAEKLDQLLQKLQVNEAGFDNNASTNIPIVKNNADDEAAKQTTNIDTNT